MSARTESRPPVESPYLTKDEAVAYSRSSRTSVERAIAAGVLDFHTVGSGRKARKLFTREQLDDWISGETRRALRLAECGPVDSRSRQRRRPA